VDAEGLRTLLKRDRLVGRGQGSLFADRGSLFFRVDGIRLRLGLAEGVASYEEVRDLLRDLQKLRGRGALSREAWEGHLRHDAAAQATAALDTFEAVADFVMGMKRDEGASEATVRSRYLPVLRRMYGHPSGAPWATSTIREAIQPLTPLGQTRRQMVPFLRQLAQQIGKPWDPSLDRTANAGKKIERIRQTDYFDDARIIQMLDAPLEPDWKVVVGLLAIYGLRPWEVTIAEPCQAYKGMVWIGQGKKSARGQNPARSVPPFRPEWVERYQLFRTWEKHGLPTSLNPGNKRQAGSIIQSALQRSSRGLLRAGEGAYGFRHSWVRRMHQDFQISDTDGALFAGHTLDCHIRTYRSWLPGMQDPYQRLTTHAYPASG
jgi:integrase